MRLVDDLAAHRILYGRPLATMPDVLLIDIPADYASPSLPLGRYYPVILETESEYAELMVFLELDRPRPIVPDLLDRRPSELLADDIVIARYAPPNPAWPWLMLCRWPADYAVMFPVQDDCFARGAYTSEAFETLDDLVHAESRLIETLGSHRSVHLAALPEILGTA